MLQDQGQSENEPVEVESENGPRRGHAKTGSYSEKDRKIGHRRIDVEGKVSYKKIETNQLMGSIQLGIQASIGGLAKHPERDLLMQDFMEVETTHFSKHGSNKHQHIPTQTSLSEPMLLWLSDTLETYLVFSRLTF